MSAQNYQVGAHFTALIYGILMAPLKIIESFFAFRVPLPDCVMLPLQKAQTYFDTSYVKRWVFFLFSPTKLFEILISCLTASYLSRSISKYRTYILDLHVWYVVWYGMAVFPT